ncbi:SymE family type I addiction module toxin [Yersinia ruckeri]|uniref:SymE family type I addiction module toxin n=1 Tax=Yersinia ruckeri TaxID=29486 RepID=UPI0020BE81E3|nr:SymE family type I addiction module toxin [Yersinia ruckeri]MCW6528578.1 type I toxin-antitoxin system SymE family toxin [Yersinia ruckeri]MCW6563436.1 type I toxin-antitoxin system SymE family toxin [Yersinia ruckeri]UZY04379.1 type I toxin-antitoxin system SymE family toxin [Yersinia ruckeri]UZY04387.1 type I toxin-antitoxin system SymE family toxin [Yersinia ruckeri]UZY04395.1 type I toxin-antitoxin system SymE family toxin [Yersinia ruckeri]
MAKQHHKSEPATPQARKCIVGYRPNGGRPNPLPQLTLKGRWLEALGFTHGQPVSITAEQGQLIIRTTPATEGNA